MARSFSKKKEEKRRGSGKKGETNADGIMDKAPLMKDGQREWFDLKDFLCALALTVLIILVSVKSVSVDKNFVVSELRKNNVYDMMSSRNISFSQVNSNASRIIDYIALKKDASLDSTFLNAKEKQHMSDVKGIFEKINLLTMIMFPLTLLLFILIYWKKIGQIYKPYILSFFIILVFVGVMIILALNFGRFFTCFHKIAFTNDLWLMDPQTDLIITLFPEQFFRDAFMRILAYPAMIAFFFFFSGMLLRRQEKIRIRY